MLPLHPGGPDAAGGVTVLGCFSPVIRKPPPSSSSPPGLNLTVAPWFSHSLLYFLFSACLRGSSGRVGGAAAAAQRCSPADDALTTPTTNVTSRSNFTRKLFENALKRLRKHHFKADECFIIYIWTDICVKGGLLTILSQSFCDFFSCLSSQ